RAVRVEALDHAVVEGVLRAVSRLGEALDRVEDVFRGDGAVHRRAELDARLQVEGVDGAAVRRLRNGGGDVGDELVPGGVGDVVVADERADEQARVDPERVAEVFAGRVEAVGEAEGLLPADPERPAGRDARARRAVYGDDRGCEGHYADGRGEP